jgi:hypothetical protein
MQRPKEYTGSAFSAQSSPRAAYFSIPMLFYHIKLADNTHWHRFCPA